MYSRTNASSHPTVDTKYPRAQKLCPTKFCFRPPYTRARCIALFPLINPITCATAYLGGIEIIMCTWSGSRCPSSIRLSFCSASLRNTSPTYFLRSPYNAFRRPLGINTTWYLHSHFEWLKLSYSSIQFLLCVCFAAHARSFLDGLPYLSNFACLPGRAGGTPISLESHQSQNLTSLCHLEGLNHDVIRLIANWNQRNQRAVRAQFGIVAGLHRAQHGDISRAGIHHQQMRFIGAKRQPIGMAAHLHRANYAAFVDGIDTDGVRPEIADVEQAVIGGNDSA